MQQRENDMSQMEVSCSSIFVKIFFCLRNYTGDRGIGMQFHEILRDRKSDRI